MHRLSEVEKECHSVVFIYTHLVHRSEMFSFSPKWFLGCWELPWWQYPWLSALPVLQKEKREKWIFPPCSDPLGEGGDSFEKASRWLLLRARPFCLPMDEVELMSRDQVSAFKKSPIQINSMADRSKYNIYCLQNQNLSFWKSLWPGQHGYGALYHKTKERWFFSLNARVIF